MFYEELLLLIWKFEGDGGLFDAQTVSLSASFLRRKVILLILNLQLIFAALEKAINRQQLDPSENYMDD